MTTYNQYHMKDEVTDVQSQGWAPSNPYMSTPVNFGWPLEPLEDTPQSTDERQLNLFELMPAFWRPGVRKGNAQEVLTGGSADANMGSSGFGAPSREQYEMYNMTAGSARLALNTRWKSPTGSMIETLPGRLAPPIPVGTSSVDFNDSDARHSLIYNSTGFWPGTQDC